jgi:hypothetical protein
MAIIGNNVIGSFADDSQAVDLNQVSKCNSGPGGKVVKAVGHVSGVSFGSGNQQQRVVIYRDSAGAPGALVGFSDIVTIIDGAAYAWVDYPFTNNVYVPSSAQIWIGYHGGAAGDTIQMKMGTATAGSNFLADTFSDGPADPYGAGAAFDGQYSLYLITEDAAQAKPHLIYMRRNR